MSRLNISAIVLAIALLYVIVGFTIYFNNTGLNWAWSIQQKDKGMVKLGVHSPEFMLEKNYTNVTAAVQRFGITHPPFKGISNQLLSLGFIDLIISRLDGSIILCSAITK